MMLQKYKIIAQARIGIHKGENDPPEDPKE
jgi:hypothetical protein